MLNIRCVANTWLLQVVTVSEGIIFWQKITKTSVATVVAGPLDFL